MKNFATILSLVFMVLMTSKAFTQEQAPVKTFDFTISLNKLKTQDQADEIRNAVSHLPGVKNCGLILTSYELTFSCTNHDMNEYLIIDRVKAIILEHGAEIDKINRREDEK